MSARSPLTLVAAVLAGTLVPLAAPAAADTGPVPLAMPSVARIVADEVHGQLFFSPGPSGTEVRVTDLQGGSARTLDGLPGATGMALTPDGKSLWVALPTVGALKRIDTAGLTVAQSISVPTGQCPGDVAVVGSRLVYGHSCVGYGGGGGYGGLGVVDAATGASYGAVTDGPFYRPVLSPGPTGQVYAADAGVSPTGLHLYDVTGSAPRPVAARAGVCSNLRDLSASPDGSSVVTACGSPYFHTVWSADKLTEVGQFHGGPYPRAGAWSADGSTFVSGVDSAYEPDVVFNRLGDEAPTRWVDFGASTTVLQPRGLAASADGRRAWAVTSSPSGFALHVLDVPGPEAASLTATATPGAFYPGASTSVTGRLVSATGQPLPGAELRVTRGATGEIPIALTAVTTDSDGTFAFHDTPPGPGSYSYGISRDADAARVEVPVLVWRTEGTLRMSVDRGTSGGAPVHGNLRLSYDGPTSPAGRTVTLVREGGGARTALPDLVTDAYGGAKFTDDPPPGEVVYRATVAAQGVHPEVTANVTTTVLTATQLSAVSPASSSVGAPLSVTGVLTAPAGPVVGATLAVSRSACGTTSWSSTATTTPNGAWSVSDPAPPVGTCTYTASYAGGDGYAASTARTSTQVTHATTLTAVAPSTAVAATALTVSGRLSSATGAVSGAPVAVERTGCSSTGWSVKATTGPDGSWSVVDPLPPSGTCAYVASYAGSSTHAATTAKPATTAVSPKAAQLTLSVVRGTGSTKKIAYVTAQLTGGIANRTVTITAQPSGGAEVALLTGQVDSTGKLTATYTPRTTTTYRARYTGDAYYAAAAVEKVQ